MTRKQAELSQAPPVFSCTQFQASGDGLKHFPGYYDMERAADMAPEIFGDFEWYEEQERERKREREMLDALVEHDQELGLYELEEGR